MQKHYIQYYNLENYLLSDVQALFHSQGYLNAFDFFCIIIWKANRAKTKIAQRLLKFNSDLEESVKSLTHDVYIAKDDKEKLKVLIEKYKFRLPMSSAILTILYPDNFTVYDIRVCDTLTKHKGLDNLVKFENIWLGYQAFVKEVQNIEPKTLLLRDKDRYLWGKSFHDQLNYDINKKFVKI